MNVSLRSQMVAGVAALGAAAVVVTPIAQPELLPSSQRAVAAVQLSAIANPIAALGGTVGLANDLIFAQDFFSDSLAWPDDFYGVEFLYAPLNFGIIPDVVNQFSTGALVGLVNNLSGYVWAVNYGLIELGTGAGSAIFNAPFAVVDAVGELIGGDPAAALNTLVTGIVDPVQTGIQNALAGVGYIVDNVIENIRTVLRSTLPYVVSGVVNALVNNVSYMASSLIGTVTTVVGDLASLDLEGAWNAAVNGLLSDTGTLGQLVAFTLGVGLAEDIDGVETVTSPSVRAVLTSELQRLGGQKWWGDNGITNDPFVYPTASAAASAPAAALESAPVAAASEAAPGSAAAADATPEAAPAQDSADQEAASAAEMTASEAPGSQDESAAASQDESAAASEDESAAAESAADVPAVADAPVRSAARAGARAAAGDAAPAGTPKRSAHRGGAKAAGAARSAN
ncbi:MAG: hypothetical protein KDB45_03940 [Mycobacterium sp.]|nr:hypothetical protein [Mycobacterium sp.]